METGQREFTLRGGRIILHTRAGDRHGVSQNRLRLGAANKLVRRSTRTTDLAEAKLTAEEPYEELRFGDIKATWYKRCAAFFVGGYDGCSYVAISCGARLLLKMSDGVDSNELMLERDDYKI